MIYHLSTGDRFTAFQGRGATRNDSPIRVNEEEKLSQAQIVLSRALCSEEVPLYHYWSENARRMRHTGCPTLDCCYVAAGTFSAYVDLHLPQGKLCVHDIAAASLIVEEAGGQLLDQDGKPLKILPSLEDRFNVFAVNNKKIFEELRRPIRYDLPHTPARET